MATLLALMSSSTFARADPAKAASQQWVALLRSIDERQRNSGDYQATAYIEQKEKDKVDVAYQAIVFRRGQDNKMMMLFTQPKESQGQGYLRVDKNLWFYDATVGRWERRTERERIGGTNSRRADFDESRLAEEYDPEDGGQEKLGDHAARILTLRGKPGVDLAFPVLKLWVDEETKNVLKRQEFALSGRLLRTSYFPQWKKLYSASKKGDVWYPQEIHLYDELETASSTLIVLKSVDLRPLEENLFTKAWLESKSR
jgi:outer membrane lipoprotein-sorting protein